MTSYFVSGYGILWNIENFYFWTDLAESWFRGQILGADSESEVIFYIRSQYQTDIGHILHFCIRKSDKHSLIIGLLWQQLKSQLNKTYTYILIFWKFHFPTSNCFDIVLENLQNAVFCSKFVYFSLILYNTDSSFLDRFDLTSAQGLNFRC